jgi:hypothetical protein
MTCFDHSHDPDYGGRWRMDVRPLVTLPIDVAPTLADVGIEPRRVRRQSHIRVPSAHDARYRQRANPAGPHAENRFSSVFDDGRGPASGVGRHS